MIFQYEELSFQILSVVHSLHRAGVYEVKRRPYAALSLKLRGDAEFEAEGKRFLVKEKNIVYIPANTDYKVDYLRENDSVVIHLMNCNYEITEGIEVEQKALVESLFLSLLREWDKEHSVNYAKAAVYGILHELSKSSRRVQNDFFESVTARMKQEYSNADFNVASVCAAHGISRSALQALFWSCAEQSPKQYLGNLRMEKALRLLTEGTLSVGEVALQCGFSDAKYFARAFKRKYGFSPSEMKYRLVSK